MAPVRPAGFRTVTVAPTTLFQKKNPSPVVTAKAPKPASTGKLHQDQVKKVADTNSTENANTQKNPFQQLVDKVTGKDDTTSSGGGGGGREDNGKTFKEIRCQTGCNQQ